jgi:hypothetical protein
VGHVFAQSRKLRAPGPTDAHAEHGFGVGHTRATQTRGIWVWGQPQAVTLADGSACQVWHGVVWRGVLVWCGVVWCGVVWCGMVCETGGVAPVIIERLSDCIVAVVWCGVVWCGVVWCGVVWCVCGANTRCMPPPLMQCHLGGVRGYRGV